MRFETEVKQWGNSLALRISSALAQELHFTKGTKVVIEASENELKVIRKVKQKRFSLPFSESELLIGLNENTAHADELAVISSKEYQVEQ